ncbi:CynX/NimT family MFS transporter [Herbiconiux sp. A18JL235]|uniref:CynX/NimT family MFS transporter n=1 Tax=Herbiconiux sp. A18JL235 TaxID=3152363 RepID=A0AB39BL09_9MICO
MPQTERPGPLRPSPLWRGRVLALFTIVFVALNLRTAVGALSPIFDQIDDDIALGSIGIGFLGLLPPVCFGVVGLVAPFLQRRFGLQPTVIGAMVVLLAGHLVRASSGDYLVLVVGSTLAFAGMGVANILLPPLVRRYFPDRIGLLTSVYATVMAIGATVPPLVAVPVAESAGWRTSVALWAVFAALALAPLVTLTVSERMHASADRTRAAAEAAQGTRPAAAPGAAPAAGAPAAGAPAVTFGRMVRSPIAWSLMLTFAITSMNAYAMFAWLPEILTQVAGVDQATAGLLLSLFSVMGLPASLFVPVLATRLGSVGSLLTAGVLFYLAGYGGLLLLPGGPLWLWVAFIGLGPLLFPLCLVLINLRTRTPQGTVALSSFVQSFGYVLGALGPLLLAVLHDLTGGWTAALLVLIGSALALWIAGAVVAKPRMLEDQWHN